MQLFPFVCLLNFPVHALPFLIIPFVQVVGGHVASQYVVVSPFLIEQLMRGFSKWRRGGKGSKTVIWHFSAEDLEHVRPSPAVYEDLFIVYCR